jgi:peptidoglycan/LPS O-acetylase OafA/YrhL
MNFDQMIEAWRAQDEAPLYGVNRDLLQLVLKHEQADLRRELRREQWAVYGVSAGLLAFLAFIFAAIYHDDDPRTVWDYVAAGLATVALLAGVGAQGVSRKRQALRERGFGNSLQEEIRRNLSLVDYQLSRTGRRDTALLTATPITLAGTLLYWLIVQINNNPFGWYEAGIVLVVVGGAVWSAISTSREAEQALLPRRRQLSELLEALNRSE